MYEYDRMPGKEKDSWSLVITFPLSFVPCQFPSSSPSAPGGLCLDRIEFSRVNMGKALSRLFLVNVSVERVISPALPTTPTYSLASGSQSADLCCWGDLVFHVGYLKTPSISLSLFSTHSLFHYLMHWHSYNHITYPSPIPLYCSLYSLPPSPFFSICLFFLLPPASTPIAPLIPATVSLSVTLGLQFHKSSDGGCGQFKVSGWKPDLCLSVI